MDVLRRLGTERPGDRFVESRARQEVLAADDVRDPEVEVVDDRREVVRRTAVGANERGALRSAGAPSGSGSAISRAASRCLSQRARSAGAGPRPTRPRAIRARAGSPPRSRPPTAQRPCRRSAGRTRRSCSSAKRRLATAVRAPPRCSDPVGLGAKRTRTTRLGLFADLHVPAGADRRLQLAGLVGRRVRRLDLCVRERDLVERRALRRSRRSRTKQ